MVWVRTARKASWGWSARTACQEVTSARLAGWLVDGARLTALRGEGDGSLRADRRQVATSVVVVTALSAP